MLRLDDSWVWDSWPWDDPQGRHHLFFLHAPRALQDPIARHHHARIGHATSTDYRTWQVLPDALHPGDEGSWDDGAVWTGSTITGLDGRHHLFYTGVSRADGYKIQRIGRADSDDGLVWHRSGPAPLVEADARWYELYDGATWHDQAWRDPWVFPDPDGDGWHMLITARAAQGAVDERAVVGHAWSPDLLDWQVRPPLTPPGQGFGQLEVMQRVVLPGEGTRTHLLFGCGSSELGKDRRAAGQTGGTWLAGGPGPLGPWDIAGAQRLRHPEVYAAHMITDVDGRPAVLGFADATPFDGVLLDPIPLLGLLEYPSVPETSRP